MKVMKIVGLVNGGTTQFDGQYLVEYDPGRNGVEPGTGRAMTCHLVTTPDIAEASRMTPTAALMLWSAVDPRQPKRPDGKPNRPISSWHILVEEVDECDI